MSNDKIIDLLHRLHSRLGAVIKLDGLHPTGIVHMEQRNGKTFTDDYRELCSIIVKHNTKRERANGHT